jgi:hypothetical protein
MASIQSAMLMKARVWVPSPWISNGTFPLVCLRAPLAARMTSCGRTCSNPMSGPYTLCGRNIMARLKRSRL